MTGGVEDGAGAAGRSALVGASVMGGAFVAGSDDLVVVGSEGVRASGSAGDATGAAGASTGAGGDATGVPVLPRTSQPTAPAATKATAASSVHKIGKRRDDAGAATGVDPGRDATEGVAAAAALAAGRARYAGAAGRSRAVGDGDPVWPAVAAIGRTPSLPATRRSLPAARRLGC
ncbi:hypothetical protein KZX46_18325 [Polymorphobacter sp. PAMC 29334]|uniref:hypothetical protein n=1 Tax=Polymorphobacter sp. PAMC 29334 TaxID=2862331 RepID=UPI001C788EE2|nr:hypothetical protein [Polymorphobacter sp. PAMC 29334]QYE34688.1 hypothetical protein KZX46_18325 [Polymorphobacter sp. PAMC 29334]